MNETINYTFHALNYSVTTIKWNDLINEACFNWKQYLINYDFYIYCCWAYIILGIITIFYNPKIKFKDENYYIIAGLQRVAIMALMIRIFQIYYISKIYLGW